VGLIQLSLAPFQGDLWETLSPGLKPRSESSCPFLLRHPDYGGQVGVENPLRNLKLMLMGSRRMLGFSHRVPAGLISASRQRPVRCGSRPLMLTAWARAGPPPIKTVRRLPWRHLPS